MFPDARISLRRWNDAAETKIPIPVAITLHNFIPPTKPNCNDISNNDDGIKDPSFMSPSKEADGARSSNRGMWLHRQPEHNNNLLPQLRLEITAVPPYQDDENKFNEKFDEQTSLAPTIVFSGDSPRTPSIHPSWEHLDERISIDEYSDWWNQNELYKSMKIKLSVLSNNCKQGIDDIECRSQEVDNYCIIESFLYPSFLERIDLGSNSNNSNPEDLDTNSLLPPGLPPNAMLVHFSDGSIRCTPQTYQILWENFGRSILEPPPVEDFSRFEDRAFDALNDAKQQPQRPRLRSASSLLDKDPSVATQNDDTGSNHGENGSSLSQSPDQAIPPPRSFNASQLGLTNNGAVPDEEYKEPNDVLYPFSEHDFAKEERRQEKLDLLRLIAEEERALEEDIDNLNDERKTLTNLMEQVQLVDREISKLKNELRKQSLKLEQEELLKESQSIKLLRDLRDIYPISPDTFGTLSSDSVIQSTRESGLSRGNEFYLIRGLRLPAEIYTTSISEEEVNASLGYCAHLIFMIAKYLAIHPRHRIFCNGSRSAIELDGVGIFPLFLGRLAARALEREQVDRGARLLGANVDCIMTHLNLSPLSSSAPFQQSHILERVQKILDFVAEGQNGA